MGSQQAHHKLDFIGDHLALNFINSRRAAEPFEVFQTDEHVLDWLRRAGVSTPPKGGDWPTGALVAKARQLREIALQAVQAAKTGKRPSLDALNSFLEHSISHLHLVRRKSKIEVEKVYSGTTVEEFLAPIAESVAELLANGDFDLVRRCEGSTCTLWFYDQTKAHRRRWCSPSVCGNRAKVAAFRARSARSPEARR